MTASDHAVSAIRDLIVSLELAPGAVIDERELMERLGIGRTPVREALRRLAHEGREGRGIRRVLAVGPVHALRQHQRAMWRLLAMVPSAPLADAAWPGDEVQCRERSGGLDELLDRARVHASLRHAIARGEGGSPSTGTKARPSRP
jgi:DNA-binding transcriptional MocR family regulator